MVVCWIREIGSTRNANLVILDRLPDPPKLVGALAPNTELQKAEKLFLKQVDGPEATVFDHGMLHAVMCTITVSSFTLWKCTIPHVLVHASLCSSIGKMIVLLQDLGGTVNSITDGRLR